MPPLRAVPPSAARVPGEPAERAGVLRSGAGADDSGRTGAERAEAALTEHYARLVRIGYLVLPPALGRDRRVLAAHRIVQRSLPRVARALEPAAALGRDPGCVYARVRLWVVRAALEAGLPPRRFALPRRVRLPSPLPQVWGLRLFPQSGGADGLALERALAGMSGPGRAAQVLRGLEGLADEEVCRVLGAAGVAEPRAALAEAGARAAPHALLASPEFDPCSLQARPADLLRRRRRVRTVWTGLAALAVCGTLVLMPGDGLGGPGASTAPLYSRHPAAEQALDPAALRRVPEGFWQNASREDFTVWPARGDRTEDSRLLGRALATWARPGPAVVSSATPRTPAGPPMGPPQLLYAGEVGAWAVVLFHDGLRVVRYAESREADPSRGAVLDFARVDGADEVASAAVVVQRRAGLVRYLTAPWVRGTAVRDLLDPRGAARPLPRRADGVTDPLPVPPSGAAGCGSWPALELRDGTAVRLMTDLGELTPARLTSGTPAAPHDVSGPAERASWARTACLLRSVRSHGVRAVNSWPYAEQSLPEGGGTALWLCTRAETWRGTGSRVLAQFQAPPELSGGSGAPGAVAARAEGSPDCGPRRPRVLAGVLWKSGAGRWYVLAAGSRQFTAVSAAGGVQGRARGRLLALPARAGDRVRLDGFLAGGGRVRALR
ncbi:hypothetical protein CP967_25030 [Streptomyces nitrosporeus]|uniref:DNA-directed RNA polymerase specialized sigma24 family protein n=1 Tax=Streptomyces nitrosporeus TaxID=28894 RepID=A0A5J6FH25_9ACTN|nr:hypothetical protein CP967_25030 [Streptomyces nitrosporeus]